MPGINRGASVPYRKPPTTKEKARKKLGDKIRKERQIKRIKRSKLERNVRQAAANEQPKKTPVLLRTEEDTASGASPRKSSGFNDRMNVDEFLESGFMKAMEDIEEGDDARRFQVAGIGKDRTAGSNPRAWAPSV